MKKELNNDDIMYRWSQITNTTIRTMHARTRGRMILKRIQGKRNGKTSIYTCFFCFCFVFYFVVLCNT